MKLTEFLKTEKGDVFINGIKIEGVVAVEIKDEVEPLPMVTISFYVANPTRIEAGLDEGIS